MKSTYKYTLIITTAILVLVGLFAIYQTIVFNEKLENIEVVGVDDKVKEEVETPLIQNFDIKTEAELDGQNPLSDVYDQNLDSPYIDLDPKLHIPKGFELDPKVIRIDYTLKEIELCGGTYKAKQVFIDGVDVAQRLAEILKEDKKKSDWWCGITLGRANDTGGIINSGEEINITLEQSGIGYSFQISLGIGFVNLTSGTPRSLDYGFGGIIMPNENKIVDIMDNLIGELHKSQ